MIASLVNPGFLPPSAAFVLIAIPIAGMAWALILRHRDQQAREKRARERAESDFRAWEDEFAAMEEQP